ncbi:MAG: hypothetical protein ACTSWY_09705, partial [Promethearchaeota archaeon]
GSGGYPFDLDLYQSVKSMCIGEMGVKDKGIIIAVNECINGVGKKEFENLLNCGKTPQQLYQDVMNGVIKDPGFWEIQILSRILSKCNVYVISSLKSTQLGNIGLKYARNVNEAINDAVIELNIPEEDISILVLPKGTQILPKITNS